MVDPKEQEIEKAVVGPAKEGVEGANALELEQSLPIAEEVEESPCATVNPTEEMEQQSSAAERGVKELAAQMDDVMGIVRQITTDVEPSTTAEVPEETPFESIPMETTVEDGATEEAEQQLLTPEEAAANLAARNSEVT